MPLTYHAIEAPTCGDQTQSADNISSVWVDQHGQWMLHLHTEYTITSKTSHRHG